MSETHDIEKMQAFQRAYGRLGGDCCDRDWNVWCAAWEQAHMRLAGELEALNRRVDATSVNGIGVRQLLAA